MVAGVALVKQRTPPAFHVSHIFVHLVFAPVLKNQTQWQREPFPKLHVCGLAPQKSNAQQAKHQHKTGVQPRVVIRVNGVAIAQAKRGRVEAHDKSPATKVDRR